MKFFTPKEANKTLPLVKRIVSDILDTSDDIRAEVIGREEEEIDKHAVEVLKELLSDYINELQEIGCLYKDWNFEIGLVDFPAIIDGDHVYLCWKSDEESVRHYHGTEAGFAGRKEIPLKYFED